MGFRGAKSLKVVSLVASLLVLVGIAAAAMPLVKDWPIKEWWKKHTENAEDPSTKASESSARLVPGQAGSIELVLQTVKRLGIETVEVKKATVPQRLEVPGTLAWDIDSLSPVRSRFPGEVVEIANERESSSLTTVPRPVRYGDTVTKGQLLAVVWSSDLGKQKSELVDALSQLRVDQKLLEQAEPLYKEGALSAATMRQYQRNVETDRNRVAAAERTLWVWRVPEEEIRAVKEEAERIGQAQGKRDPEKEKSWARVEVRAPVDGVIVEKNVVLHNIVDTSSDLFKVASLKRLTVWAHVFEEDLPALQALKPEQRRWKVRLQSEPTAKPLPGQIEVIGYAIDPNQHTAVVMGHVDNPGERLRVGQFVTATVDIPPASDEVIIPTTALVEDGRESVVFVQPDPKKPVYAQRRVAVVRRGQSEARVRNKLKPEEEKKGLRQLQAGEWVVLAGNLELKAALEDLQTSKK